MSDNVQNLLHDRGRLWEEAKALDERANAEGRSLNAEEQATWDRLMTAMDEKRDKVKEIEDRAASLKQHQDEIEQRRISAAQLPTGDAPPPADTDEGLENRYKAAFDEWTRYGKEGMSAEAREAMHEYEARATGDQNVGTAAKGGTLAPTDFRPQIIEQLLAFGGMRSGGATVITTSHGRNIDYPTYEDVGASATIVSEGSTFKSTHVPISKFTLEAAKYGVIIKVSDELLQDTLVPVESWLPRAIGVRFARGTEAHFATRSSTESAGPHGLTNASTGALAVVNNALTADNLITLLHKVDPAYRANARWMFNDATEEDIRQLKFGSTTVGSREYVWQPSFQAGVPDRLLGYPVSRNYSLDGFGTSGNKPVWFGDMSAYYIRDSLGVEIRRLTERYAPSGHVGFLAFMRTDGRHGFATTTPARKPIRCIVQAT